MGSRIARAELFETQRMGTGGAFDSLMATERDLNLGVAVTESCCEVDKVEDPMSLAIELRSFPQRALRTAASLARRLELRGR